MVASKSNHITTITSDASGTERENSTQINTPASENTEEQNSSRFEAAQQPQNTDAAELKTTKKDGRKRTRHIYNSIRAQMEFYFGDANLSKDRFLKQLVDQDPYVPLNVFLTFNKLKTLTQSVSQIAKSLSNSQLLELDASGQKVRRKTALSEPRDVDKKTLYVEALPVTANHDWVRQVFERFGEIAYVSLPRYAVSRKIKEFAFIEYENESSVEKAVKAFQQFDGVLTLQSTDPADLCSVQSYLREQKLKQIEHRRQRQLSEQTNAGVIQALGEKLEDSQKVETQQMLNSLKSRKRRRSIDSTEASCASRSNDSQIPKQPTLAMTKSNISTKNKDSELSTETGMQEPNLKNVEDPNDKNKIELLKQQKKKKKKAKVDEIDMDPSCFDMKILPKWDWKRLRNKYLNMQREKVAELKRKNREFQESHKYTNTQQQLLESHANVNQPYDSLTKDDDSMSPVPNKSLKSDNIGNCSNSGSCNDGVHKMSMNFYGAGDGDLDDTNCSAAIKTANLNKDLSNWEQQQRGPPCTHELGLIIEVNLLEPCVNVKEFKADMRQYATVKYVDIKEGAIQAYLRLESAAAADELVVLLNCAEYKCKVLQGKSELRYWKKIETDREAKLNKKVKVPQKRGREKIQKLMGTHIRFGDDDYADPACKFVDTAGSGALDDNAEGSALCESYPERIG